MKFDSSKTKSLKIETVVTTNKVESYWVYSFAIQCHSSRKWRMYAYNMCEDCVICYKQHEDEVQTYML
jgi:hypothetical protein